MQRLSRLIWVLLATVATAPAAAPAAPRQWQIELRSGDRLSGELRRLDTTLGLYRAEYWGERSFDVASVARLLQLGVGTEGRTGVVLTLRLGDRLVGEQLRLENGVVTLAMGAGASLRIPKDAIATLRPHDSREREVMAGLDAFVSDAHGTVSGWEAVPDGLCARSVPAILSRDDVLSDRVRVELAAPLEPAPSLLLRLFTDPRNGGRRTAGAGYVAQLVGNTFTLEWQTAAGATRPVGSCRLPPVPPGALLQFSLTVDLTRRRFQLAAADGVCGDWTDIGAETPTARGLELLSLKAPAFLHRFAVTQLPDGDTEERDPGHSPAHDRLLLLNGDVAEGTIEAIDERYWTLRRATAVGPLRLPTTVVRLARLQDPPEAVTPLATKQEILLCNGSRLRSATVQVRAGRLLLDSPVWGCLDLPLESLAEIRFGRP